MKAKARALKKKRRIQERAGEKAKKNNASEGKNNNGFKLRLWLKAAAAIVLIIFIILIVQLALLLSKPRITKTIQMDIAVSDKLGFNLDTDALHFGAVMPGNCASRSLSIGNNGGKKYDVKISAGGQLAEIISFSKTSFQIMPGETKEIGVSACPENNMQYGQYNGTIQVVFRE